MRKTLRWAAMLVASSFLTSTFSPLSAAQGQITEVNPSGVHGTVVVLQADEGEEIVKGDNISFVNPRAFQGKYVPQIGDKIEFDAVKNGKHIMAVNIKQAVPCICIGCCGSHQETSSAKLTTGSEATSWGTIKESMK